MKRIGIFEVSKRKQVKTGITVFDSTFEDLCKHEPNFKHSSLKSLFAQSSVKSIMIMLYEADDGERRRMIAGSTGEWADEDEIKALAKLMGSSKDIEVEFDAPEGFSKRLVTTKREDRDLLKDIFKNMKPSHG